MSMPPWLLTQSPIFTSWHRHISPCKFCLWVQAEFLVQFQRGEQALLCSWICSEEALPSPRSRPDLRPSCWGASGGVTLWQNLSMAPCHRARQRSVSGYAQNTQVQQKQGRQQYWARDLKLLKTYWGLCLIRGLPLSSTSKILTKS